MSRTEPGGVERPFSDWPHTEFIEDEGWLHITGKYKAPSWFWQQGFMLIMVLLGTIFAPFSCVVMKDNFYGGSLRNMPGEAIIYTTLGWAALVLVIVMAGEYFGRRRRLNVKLSREYVGIGGKNYARNVPHQYAMEEHEGAHAEDGAEMRTGSRVRIYRDAQQVVMRYGERRVVVASFHRSDARKAEALLVRLQMLDKGLDEMLGMAEQEDAGAAPGERDDFGTPPPIR